MLDIFASKNTAAELGPNAPYLEFHISETHTMDEFYDKGSARECVVILDHAYLLTIGK